MLAEAAVAVALVVAVVVAVVVTVAAAVAIAVVVAESERVAVVVAVVTLGRTRAVMAVVAVAAAVAVAVVAVAVVAVAVVAVAVVIAVVIGTGEREIAGPRVAATTRGPVMDPGVSAISAISPHRISNRPIPPACTRTRIGLSSPWPPSSPPRAGALYPLARGTATALRGGALEGVAAPVPVSGHCAYSIAHRRMRKLSPHGMVFSHPFRRGRLSRRPARAARRLNRG